MITDYHSKYLASDLVRRRSSDSSDKLAVAVAGAQVDMNPHQVERSHVGGRGRYWKLNSRLPSDALSKNGRMTVRELAAQIGLSSPSITERIHKLEDAGAIRGYTITVDPKAFGLGIAAHVRMRALPGEVKRLAQMLVDTPEVIEADRVTGEDCFLAKVVVSDLHELETVIDRFVPFSSTDTSIVQSSPVVRRLPKL